MSQLHRAEPGSQRAMRVSRALAFIVAVAVALRVAAVVLLNGVPGSTDEWHWQHMAQAFLDGGLLDSRAYTYRPPLYPLLMALTYHLVGVVPNAVRGWQILLSAATCVLVHRVGLRLGDERTALLSAALAAVYPLFIFFVGLLMAETTLIFLTLVCVLAALRWFERGSMLDAGILGVSSGLTALCKPVILAWLPLVLLAGVWRQQTAPVSAPRARGRFEQGRWRVLGGHGAALVAGVVMVLGPWSARNAAVIGHWVPVSTNLGINLLIGHEPRANGTYREGVDYLSMYRRLVNGEPNPAVSDGMAIRRVVGWMVKAPRRSLVLALRKVGILWSPVVTGARGWQRALGILSTFPVMALGLVGLFWRRRTCAGLVVGTLALAMTLVHAVIFAHTRFRLPLDAALMAPAAWVVVQGWDALRGKPG